MKYPPDTHPYETAPFEPRTDTPACWIVLLMLLVFATFILPWTPLFNFLKTWPVR